MGWLERLESRSSTLADPAPWLFEALGARSSSSGISVTPENALEVSSIWAAVRLISSTLATLPLHVYKHTGDGKEKAREHPLYSVLHDRPNPEMSSFVYREVMAAHLLLYGASFSEIELNERGDVVALWPIHPVNMRMERLQNGKRVYIVRVDGSDVVLRDEQVLHIPGFSLDGQNGLIPVHLMREAVGLTKATERFGASFFGNNALPSGVITLPSTVGKEKEKELRDAWQRQHGGLSNAQRVAILSGGMEFNALGVPPEAAQFLETRKYQVTEVARLFNIPPHLIGDLERATFSNIEHQAIQYVTHCIEPWTRRMEQELNYKLLDAPYFSEFALEGLLRGDSKTRGDFYAQALNNGWMTINEVRERENLNRIEGGDVSRVPLNTVPANEDGNDG